MNKKLNFDGSKIRDIAGFRSGLLVAICPVGWYTNPNTQMRDAVWKCLCDCGDVYEIRGTKISNGYTKSCGCSSNELGAMSRTKHGGATRKGKSRTYLSWQNMIQRCTNPDSTGYIYYGGRGITVCDRWLNSFENFLEDMGDRPDNKTIDRVDVNSDYSKENCKWSDIYEQGANKRTSLSSADRVVGIQWSKTSCMWRARMCRDGKHILDSYFHSEAEAIEARLAAEVDYTNTKEK